MSRPAADLVVYTPAGTGAIPGTVAAALGRTVYATDFMSGDGTTDDYAGLQRLATYVNTGAVNTVVFPPGTYRINQYRITAGASQNAIDHVRWTNLTGVRIVGYGAKIDVKGNFNRAADSGNVSYSNSVCPFYLVGCTNVTIEGFELDGNVDQMTRGGSVVESDNRGVYTQACKRVRLVNLNVHHWPEDGVYVGGSATTACRQIYLENVHCWANARQGVSLIQVRGFTSVNGRYEGQGLTNAAGTAIGTYPGHAPQAGVDIEPNFSTATGMDVNTGAIRFRGDSFKENVGSQFVSVAGVLNAVDSVLLSGVEVEQGGSTSAYTVILAVAHGVIENSRIHVKHRAIYPQFTGSTNTYTVLRNNRIIASDDGTDTGQGIVAAVDTVGANARVLIEGNALIGEMTRTANSYMPQIQSRYVRFEKNYVYMPAKAHDGTSFHVCNQLQAGVFNGNTYDTNLTAGATTGAGTAATSSEHFASNYSAGASVANERYVAGTYYRGLFNATWDNTYPFGGLGVVDVPTPVVLTATATLDFPSISANSSAELTVTVPGAVAGNTVLLGPPTSLNPGLSALGYVSSANTVTVRLVNSTGSAIDPASASWRASVLR